MGQRKSEWPLGGPRWGPLFFLLVVLLFCCVVLPGASATDGGPLNPQPKEGNSIDPQVSTERENKLAQALDLKFGERGQKPDQRKAAALLEEIIKENSTDSVAAQALWELGDLHLLGIPSLFGVQRDSVAAVRHFIASASLGYGPALHGLGFAHAVGLGGVTRDEATATQLQYLGALTGYVPSLLAMAFRLLYGDGMDADCWAALALYKEDVLQYWEAQAKNDDPVASYELAKLLEQRQQQQQQQQQDSQQQQQETPSDEATKRRMAALLQKAGDNNMGAALRDLALAHLQGNGVPQDVEKAISLLERASAAGDADAQNYLGYFYWVGKEEGDANSNNSSSSSSSSSGSSKSSSGFVLKKDLAKAERFFTLAALQEHPEAFYFLGEIRLQQAADIKQETEKAKVLAEALRYHGRAAEGGYHLAWLREGEALETKANKKRHLPDANHACEAAALAFKAAAEFGVGADNVRRALQLYYEKDYEGSLLLNLAAAEEGIEMAQWNSAFLLRSGAASVPGAAAVAAKQQEKQQQIGPHLAGPSLAEILPSSEPEQQQGEQEQPQQQTTLVYRQLNRAALQGNIQALREIGLMHATNTEGATKDEHLASQVLLRSLSLGDLQSLPPLALTLERRAEGHPRLLQRAEEMLQYFLESGGPRETDGAPEVSEGGRGNGWFKGLWRSAGCRAAIWRIRLKRRMKPQRIL